MTRLGAALFSVFLIGMGVAVHLAEGAGDDVVTALAFMFTALGLLGMAIWVWATDRAVRR